MDRRKITFRQAEGIDTLPSQLDLGVVPKGARAKLWALVYSVLENGSQREHGGFYTYLRGELVWSLRSYYVDIRHFRVDEIDSLISWHTERLSAVVLKGEYFDVFELLQVLLRSLENSTFSSELESILESEFPAYRVIDGDTIVPIASVEESLAYGVALSALTEGGFDGARVHLKEAGSHLSSGQFSDSARESINAVESVVRKISGEKTLGNAIGALKRKGAIHEALCKGVLQLYGYGSSEQGIRHPKIDGEEDRVTEADALLMLGCCAAIVTYLSKSNLPMDIE